LNCGDYHPEQWNKDECISSCSVKASFDVNAKLIIVITHSGNTAIRVRTHQPKATILAITQSEDTAQRLMMKAGIYPVLVGNLIGAQTYVDRVIEDAKVEGLLGERDRVVVTSGSLSKV